ncbi:glycosyltransferase family 4 protein [Candidatus Shapirobacteria bacterium]|nr:glycosyltransferase family 4 protein [Candidatus Shapirobacteria bacterium]
MTIAIDISQIVYGTGASVYAKNLAENLLALDRKNRYLLFGGSLRQKEALVGFLKGLQKKYPQRVKAKVAPYPPTFLDWLWNKIHLLPVETVVGKVDIFFASDWTQPPAEKAKLVTAVHDLVAWRYPETLPDKIVNAQKNRMRWIKKEADLVFSSSQSTARDLERIIGLDKERIKVIYPGVDHTRFCPQDEEKIKAVKKKYGLGDYFLAVGTREPRKNLPRLVEAFEGLENKGKWQLAVAGKTGWGEQELGSENKNLKLLGYVPDEDLPPLYAGSFCFVYPSLYEGFGLPVLEAMACGAPVITSNVSSLPEAAGEAAILVNPNETEEIEKAMEKVARDPKLRAQMTKKGFLQTEKFSWQKTAREILRSLETII